MNRLLAPLLALAAVLISPSWLEYETKITANLKGLNAMKGIDVSARAKAAAALSKIRGAKAEAKEKATVELISDELKQVRSNFQSRHLPQGTTIFCAHPLRKEPAGLFHPGH